MKPLKRLVTAARDKARALSPDCREASRLQSEALDHPLPPAQRFGLRVHLLLCRWCRRYGKQIRFLRQAAHGHPDSLAQAIPEELSSEARARLKQSLRQSLRDAAK